MSFKSPNPDAWKFLSEFKGEYFTGEWPTVTEMFDITVKRYPNNECFVAILPEELRLTYTQVKNHAQAIARFLYSQGVRKGDKVAVSGKNSPEWALAYLGVLYAGATVVPLDITYNDKDMETLLAFAGVKCIFIDADRIQALDSDGRAALEGKYCLEKNDKGFPYVLDLDAKGDFPIEKTSEDDVAALLFTSGTTGTPKGVMLTNKNLVSDCYLAQEYMLLYPTDVFYAILPLHHAYTMLAVFIETISVGASCVFGKRLVVPLVLKELREGKVTMFLAVPLLFNKLLSALMDGVKKKGKIVYGLIRGLMGLSGFLKKRFNISVGHKWFNFLLKNLSLENCRICICGGGPLPSSTFKLYNELGINFVQGYGLTETSPITHLNPVEAYNVDSVGRHIPGCEVKIVDPDSDGNGTIFLRGPMVMKGYYNNEEATKAVLFDDGWFDSGDVGHEDEDGYLFLTGRKKNIIVSEGGKNIFPEEIEDQFQLYYDIDTICVVGYTIDEATKSEGVGAVVYPAEACLKAHKDDLEAHINSIIETVNKTLQSYKKITKVILTDKPLPMTSTKKVRRMDVIDEYKDKLNA